MVLTRLPGTGKLFNYLVHAVETADHGTQRATMGTSSATPTGSSGNKNDHVNKKRSSYDSFLDVDTLVAKPILGSDGAAAWQEFKQETKLPPRHSAAPKAPLKGADRAAGFNTWQQERENEEETRRKAGHGSLEESRYTNFKKKQHQGNKTRKAVLARKRPENVPYFLPASTFDGWKFDYVFTTRDRGTGYYWDGTDSVKRILEEEARNDGQGSAADLNDSNEPKKQSEKDLGISGKTKKIKRQGPVIVDDPMNPREQVAAALRRHQQRIPLPPGWEAATDPATGKMYYYNKITSERSWTLPQMLSAKQENLPRGWSIANDSASGKLYYYNSQTKECRWDPPSL